MIEISKKEAMYLRKKFKSLDITRTCKNKGGAHRGKRFVEESKHIIDALKIFDFNFKHNEEIQNEKK
ncbi:MAG: hypothetical protein RR370_01765 [Synergistaceae bacterium]